MTFPGPGRGWGLPRSDPGKEEDRPLKDGLIAGRFIASREIRVAVISVWGKWKCRLRETAPSGRSEAKFGSSRWCQRGGAALRKAGVSSVALHCVSAHQPEARVAGSLPQGPSGGRAVKAASRGPGAWDGEVAPGGQAKPVLCCAKSRPFPWARIPGPFEKASTLGAPGLCEVIIHSLLGSQGTQEEK